MAESHDPGTEQPLMFTLSTLAANTSSIIQEVNDKQVPAIITHCGRFVARIDPLVGVDVEGMALAAILADTDIDTSGATELTELTGLTEPAATT